MFGWLEKPWGSIREFVLGTNQEWFLVLAAVSVLAWIITSGCKVLYLRKQRDMVSLRSQVHFLRDGGGSVDDYYGVLTKKKKNAVVFLFYIYCSLHKDFAEVDKVVNYRYYKAVRKRRFLWFINSLRFTVSAVMVVSLTALAALRVGRAETFAHYIEGLWLPVAMFVAWLGFFFTFRAIFQGYRREFKNLFFFMKLEGKKFFEAHESSFNDFSRKILGETVIKGSSRRRVEKTIGRLRRELMRPNDIDAAFFKNLRKRDLAEYAEEDESEMPSAVRSIKAGAAVSASAVPQKGETAVSASDQGAVFLQVMQQQGTQQQMMMMHQSQMMQQQGIQQSQMMQQHGIQQSQIMQQESFKQNMMMQQQMAQSNMVNQGLMAQNAALQRHIMLTSLPSQTPSVPIVRPSLSPPVRPMGLSMPMMPPPGAGFSGGMPRGMQQGMGLQVSSLARPLSGGQVMPPVLDMSASELHSVGEYDKTASVPAGVLGVPETADMPKPIASLGRVFKEMGDELSKQGGGNAFTAGEGVPDIVIDPQRELSGIEKRLGEFFNAKVVYKYSDEEWERLSSPKVS